MGIKLNCGPDWAEAGYVEKQRIRMNQKVRIFPFLNSAEEQMIRVSREE
jgi:hypothetical protein